MKYTIIVVFLLIANHSTLACDYKSYDSENFEICIKEAKKGDLESQFHIVKILHKIGEKKLALHWLKKAAVGGHQKAQVSIGMLYLKGDSDVSVEKDPKEAVLWLTKAADQGSKRAQIKLAWHFTMEALATDNFEDIATGKVVSQDAENALFWSKKAADSNDAKAQYLLGIKYAMGFDGKNKIAKALNWYRKSAEQGYSPALLSLGTLYYKGDKVLQNYKKAHMYWNLAASYGDESASNERDMVAEKMTNIQISEAQDMAAIWVDRIKKQ